jgi:hypothetical protein
MRHSDVPGMFRLPPSSRRRHPVGSILPKYFRSGKDRVHLSEMTITWSQDTIQHQQGNNHVEQGFPDCRCPMQECSTNYSTIPNHPTPTDMFPATDIPDSAIYLVLHPLVPTTRPKWCRDTLHPSCTRIGAVDIIDGGGA